MREKEGYQKMRERQRRIFENEREMRRILENQRDSE